MNNCIRATADAGGIGLIRRIQFQYWEDIRSSKSHDQGYPCHIYHRQIWVKGFSMQGGIAEVRRYHASLIDLIQKGQAKPTFIASSETGIEDVSDGYRRFF